MRPGFFRVLTFGLLALAALILALAGCGGSEGGAPTASMGASTEARPSGGSAEPSPGPPAAAFQPKPHHDSGGGAAQFVVKGADNSVQEFGAEASEAELQAAASALHAFLDARAERNWAAACTYLAKAVTQGFAQLASRPPKSKGQSCAASLAALSGKTSTATLREAAVADVGSLRTEGDQAFLVYRGAGGTVYAISLAREGGAWKVASLAAVPLS